MVVKEETEEDSSRNLLHHFVGNHGGDSTAEAAGGGDTCDVELSLGLSLNGCFGVEPKEKRLIRSSSISSFSIFPIERNVPLTKTCSLPTETEEERRKRKEMESFKRMEAKRKRSEKRAAKDGKDSNFDDCLNNLHNGNNKGGQIIGGKMNGVVVKGEVGRWVMGKGTNGGGRPSSQGSIGSQGSSSSSFSDFESKPMQGNWTEVKSPLTTIPPASASNNANQEASAREGDEPLKKKSCVTNGAKESERSMMEEMPCVSTKGEGPDGRRVQGFLYNYRRGGEVRIVCVCHGQFLTPAEFVKHAGGGDVAHPLRHIVVDQTSTLL